MAHDPVSLTRRSHKAVMCLSDQSKLLLWWQRKRGSFFSKLSFPRASEKVSIEKVVSWCSTKRTMNSNPQNITTSDGGFIFTYVNRAADAFLVLSFGSLCEQLFAALFHHCFNYSCLDIMRGRYPCIQLFRCSACDLLLLVCCIGEKREAACQGERVVAADIEPLWLKCDARRWENRMHQVVV